MIYIFGHRNPDTDSVSSAIALSHFKNKIGVTTIPCVLGELNKESKFILDYFEVEKPRYINNIKTQIKDLSYDNIQGITPNNSILYAYKTMENKNLRTLPIIDNNNKLLGIVTMKDIAMGLIKGDYYSLRTDIDNIIYNLDGVALSRWDDIIEGKISVINYYKGTVKKHEILNENSIVIVGDRYDIIDFALDCKVKLIIITGGEIIPDKFIEKASNNKVNMILVKEDTYTTSKLINQCNYIESIMITKNILKFNESEYLDDVKDELIENRHSNYPIISEDNKFLGFMSRRHIIRPNRKKAILVDHNEYSQSIDGLKEAHIIEIVDHHKIGDISTINPISFTNIPVGSTCTIVYNMFKERNINIDRKIAGVLISGIISDTLYFKSPTTTSSDKKAVNDLNEILNLNLDDYVMKMFKAGTSLEGQSIKDIFFKDFKEFTINSNKIGISQVFTLDIDEVISRKDYFLEFINEIHTTNNYYVTLLVVTDIIKEGSYILYKSVDEGVIYRAFGNKDNQFMFVENMISRKKQIVPKLINSINQYN